MLSELTFDKRTPAEVSWVLFNYEPMVFLYKKFWEKPLFSEQGTHEPTELLFLGEKSEKSSLLVRYRLSSRMTN